MSATIIVKVRGEPQREIKIALGASEARWRANAIFRGRHTEYLAIVAGEGGEPEVLIDARHVARRKL